MSGDLNLLFKNVKKLPSATLKELKIIACLNTGKAQNKLFKQVFETMIK